MRKALLVIALMGAAFVGGSLANGSGKGWIQQGLKLIPHEGPGVISSGAAPEGVQTSDGPPVVSNGGGAIPAAPVPPLSVGPVPEDAVVNQQAAPTALPPADPAATSTPPPALAQGQTAQPPIAAPMPAAPTPIAEPEAPPRMLDPAALGNNLPRPGDPSTPPPAPLDPAAPPPVAAVAGGADSGWADAPGSAPAAAVVPPPASQLPPKTDPAVALAGGATPPAAPGTAEVAPAAGQGQGQASRWAELQNKMKALGVSRYWVEGEPGGSLHFRCLIPLAGQRAVSQQFEAEADDLLQAADAALRRVALWRATETP